MTLSAPRRDAALLRLLGDWEAGRMTPLPTKRDDRSFWYTIDDLFNDQHIAFNGTRSPGGYTLTPAGLPAARQAREQQKGEG